MESTAAYVLFYNIGLEVIGILILYLNKIFDLHLVVDFIYRCTLSLIPFLLCDVQCKLYTFIPFTSCVLRI